MSIPTLYIADSFKEEELIALQGKEAWHALGVRRVEVGDCIRLIDGKGGVANATVELLESKHSAHIRVTKVEKVSRPTPDIILATAIAKGDRQSTLLDMSTQLGIRAWQPLQCQRSVSKVGKNSYDRWQRVCLEACKQSGSAWLPEILPLLSPQEATVEAINEGRKVLFAHPDGVILPTTSISAVLLLIGPEGGFTDQEVASLVALGATKIALGSNILRVETAAVSFVARLRVK